MVEDEVVGVGGNVLTLKLYDCVLLPSSEDVELAQAVFLTGLLTPLGSAHVREARQIHGTFS